MLIALKNSVPKKEWPMARIEIYDTTLRDGSQGENISFTLADKIRIAEKLDEFGIAFIEGGWPGSNPKDTEFFHRMARQPLKNSQLVAFGSTRRKTHQPAKDPNLKALIASGTEWVAIFGKSWDLHVREVLRTSLEENLVLIEDSVAFLKEHGRKVIFDAEHFFDGYQHNPDYALKTLQAAERAGAVRIVLCDTNGGCLPEQISAGVQAARKCVAAALGIHTHNDSGLSVANTIAAVKAGAVHVQGTMNGLGERCGNADLTAIIPILQLKMGFQCVPESSLKQLTALSRFVYEVANMVPAGPQPFVGLSAFAHKGGIHVDAMSKNSRSYEHISPEKVGNQRRILISELSGKSTILQKMKNYNLEKQPELTRRLVEMVAELEKDGYQFEAAEASFDLMVRKALGQYRQLFRVEGFRVIVEKRGNRVVSEATVKISVDGQVEHTASEGNGPVNALDNALRKALIKFYPELAGMRLTDYRVRILHAEKATGAITRVLIESADEKDTWGTIGLSENIIEASWKALVDSFEFKLLKDR